jgi:hypothetical protein
LHQEAPVPRSPALFAVAVLQTAGLCAPALAGGTLQPTRSTAELSVQAYAGVAIVDANLPCADLPHPDEVENCSFSGTLSRTVVNAPPGSVGVDGSGTAQAEESLWAARMTLEWNTWQTYGWSAAAGDLVLSGGGGHASRLWSEVVGPAVPPGFKGTRQVTVLNLQTLEFTLSSPTSITYRGSAYGEYMPVLLARQDATGSFVDEGNIPESYTGSLAAGTYRLRNFFLRQDDFEDKWAYGWSYSLTFHDTALAVPEAPAGAMLALGLAAVGWRCRRVGNGRAARG